MDRCPGCNVRDLPRCWLGAAGLCGRLDDPTWAGHNRGRSAVPEPEPELPPPAAPPGPPVAEARALRARMRACPHRTPHSCGCGELATCALGKGDRGTVDHHDCRTCLLGDDWAQSSAAAP